MENFILILNAISYNADTEKNMKQATSISAAICLKLEKLVMFITKKH